MSPFSITIVEQEQELILEQEAEGMPVCGGNLQTPVEYQSQYIDEIHYMIGNRLYIENAD